MPRLLDIVTRYIKEKRQQVKKSKSDHLVVSAVFKAGLGVWRVFETAHPLGQKPEKMVNRGGNKQLDFNPS